MPTSLKLPSGQKLSIQSICPSPPRKHPRETNSQYLHRVSLVASQVDDSELVSYLDPEVKTKQLMHLPSEITNNSVVSSKAPSTQKMTTTPRCPPRRSRYSAIRSIAAYKHKKYVRYCLRLISFAIYRYALKRRFKKYSVYATLIQKNVRRHIVTTHLESLILALMQRKADYEKTRASGLLLTVETSTSAAVDEVKLTKEKSVHFRKQYSKDSSISTSVSKLFNQMSGDSDDPVDRVENVSTSRTPMPPRVGSSNSSSRMLLGGLVVSPPSTKNILGDWQNPRTLNQKRSFSRTYSDVLSKQEAEVKSRVSDQKDNAGGEKLHKSLSLASDTTEPYSPAREYVQSSPELEKDKSKSFGDKNSSGSFSSFLDQEDVPITQSKSSSSIPIDELNRLSIESGSTVKTSDTIKREDAPKRKPPLPESRSSFSLSNFSLSRPFTRSDKSPPRERPNLSTITEGC